MGRPVKQSRPKERTLDGVFTRADDLYRGITNRQSRKKAAKWGWRLVGIGIVIAVAVTVVPLVAPLFGLHEKVLAFERVVAAAPVPDKGSLEEAEFVAYLGANRFLLERDGKPTEVPLAAVSEKSKINGASIERYLVANELCWLEESSTGDGFYIWLSSEPKTANSCLNFILTSSRAAVPATTSDAYEDLAMSILELSHEGI